MADQQPEAEPNVDATNAKSEAFWVDFAKSMGCGMMMLLITVIVGGALAVAVIAPWGRASFDCSIYCVIRQYLGF